MMEVKVLKDKNISRLVNKENHVNARWNSIKDRA